MLIFGGVFSFWEAHFTDSLHFRSGNVICQIVNTVLGGVRPQFWRPSCQAHLWTGPVGWLVEFVMITISRWISSFESVNVVFVKTLLASHDGNCFFFNQVLPMTLMGQRHSDCWQYHIRSYGCVYKYTYTHVDAPVDI